MYYTTKECMKRNQYLYGWKRNDVVLVQNKPTLLVLLKIDFLKFCQHGPAAAKSD